MNKRVRTLEELEEKMPTLVRWGVRRAYRETMASAGYVIRVEGGYLVKAYADGRCEPIRKLPERKRVEAGRRVLIS